MCYVPLHIFCIITLWQIWINIGPGNGLLHHHIYSASSFSPVCKWQVVHVSKFINIVHFTRISFTVNQNFVLLTQGSQVAVGAYDNMAESRSPHSSPITDMQIDTSPEVICFGCWPKLPYKTPSDPLDPWREPAGDLFQVGETDVTRSIPSHLVFPYGVLLKLKQGSTQRHTQTPITVSTSNTKMQNPVGSPQ